MEELIKEVNAADDVADPRSFEYYQNIKDRVIWIDEEITDDTLDVVEQIIRFNKEDKDIPVEERKPIRLYINSNGGALDICFSILDTIDLSKTPVYTYNMGKALSAGGLILLAGHKRYALKNSIMLIHSGSGIQSGTYEQVQAQIKDYDHVVKSMRNYIIEHSKITQAQIKKNQTLDWYIYADEQIELGIVDDIIKNIDELC